MPPFRPVTERLWEKIKKTDSSEDCWFWTGAKTRQGYGTIAIKGKAKLAHRTVYETSVEPIPDELCVMHICDNPSCCNPKHLKLGTIYENNKDRHEKNRSKGKAHKGENSPMSKLTSNDVLEIFKSEEKLKEIAKKFGITFQTVSDIQNGKSWNWLTKNEANHRAGGSFK